MKPSGKKKYHQNWLRLYLRFLKLYLIHTEKSSELITKSYNSIAKDYDTSWTCYMGVLSDEMLDRIPISKGMKTLDLACGTGYVTKRLAELSGGMSIGVDASKPMLSIAQQKFGKKCTFIYRDLESFLQNQSSNSFDIITCAWGFGYFRPIKILKEIFRILTSGGYVGIIDHSRSSNSKIVKLAFKAHMENPEELKHLMRVYYLNNCRSLALRMKLCKFHIFDSWDGEKTFYEHNAKAVIERLTKTGAAVGGIEFSTDEKYRDSYYNRIVEIIQKQCGDENGVPIWYKYLAAIGKK